MIDPKKVIIDSRLEVEKDDFRREFWQEKVKEYGFISISYALFSAFCSLSGAFIVYIMLNSISTVTIINAQLFIKAPLLSNQNFC